MKKYACHRLYGADRESVFHAQSVVCIDESGFVSSFYPLSCETSHTEWVGGVVILSSTMDMKLENNFAFMLQKYYSPQEKNLYAWHLSNFDFAKDDFSSQTVLSRLK